MLLLKVLLTALVGKQKNTSGLNNDPKTDVAGKVNVVTSGTSATVTAV